MGKESEKRVEIIIYIDRYIDKKLINFAVEQKLIQHCKSTILQ